MRASKRLGLGVRLRVGLRLRVLTARLEAGCRAEVSPVARHLVRVRDRGEGEG